MKPPSKPLMLFLACVMGLLNGYDVVDLPSIPGGQAVQTRIERESDHYAHRVGCAMRQVRVLSEPGEPAEGRIRAVERYCDGTSLPSQPR